MSYAILELDFYRLAIPGSEYLMTTSVDATVTTPASILKCLVISKGDSTAEERLARVGTYAEVIGPNILPELPEDVDVFSSDLYGSFILGDEIAVTAPEKWKQLFNSGDTVVRNVVGFVSGYGNTRPILDTPFPAFARELSFTVNNGQVYYDGVASRDFTGLSGILFRTAFHADTWTSLTDAQNKYAALPGEAQALVNALNEDNWSGSSSDRYS